ncbi:MAG TPA: hypothetical protein VK324_07755 [Tepidisphaeraceae bacterium]|nr:hypothetical protein [Tepidisphaeraceae bacterium]
MRRRQDELDDVRVRQVLTLRRGLFRQRSYCLIGAGALLVLAGQLGWMTYTRVRAAGWQPRPVGYVLIAVVALSCATVLLRFARGFARELATSTMPEPTTPPDFSTLSDGSQRAENLNHVR